jgi:hypothetical protein
MNPKAPACERAFSKRLRRALGPVWGAVATPLDPGRSGREQRRRPRPFCPGELRRCGGVGAGCSQMSAEGTERAAAQGTVQRTAQKGDRAGAGRVTGRSNGVRFSLRAVR